MDDTFKNLIHDTLAALRHGEQGFADVARVSSVHADTDGIVTLALEIDPALGTSMEELRQNAEKAICAIDGVTQAAVILTARRENSAPSAASSDPHGMNKNPPLTLPFKHVIAVGSGKGGVGKSTVAYNLAAALAASGLKAALLDADIYGPSVGVLSGLRGQKPVTNEAGKLVPLEAHGLKLMSMGFLVEEGRAMIWRGPMVQSAFYQMLRDVDWTDAGADMDVLVIDLPPGTGDVQLTLAQKVPVTGAVIVSTPQDLALIDARKAIAMFEKTNVAVLGIVENMAYYCCPNCGHTDHIFGHGGARAEADKHGVAFLGDIPLDPQIRAQADAGETAAHPAYAAIAAKIRERLV